MVCWKDETLELLPDPQGILRLVAVDIQLADVPPPTEDLGNAPRRIIKDARPSRMMMYIWQNPVMLMAWSVVAFILGLVIHITAPLRHDSPGARDWRSAVLFLVSGGPMALNFAWCSFWLYRCAKNGRNLDEREECGSVRLQTLESASPEGPRSIIPIFQDPEIGPEAEVISQGVRG